MAADPFLHEIAAVGSGAMVVVTEIGRTQIDGTDDYRGERDCQRRPAVHRSDEGAESSFW